MAASDYYEVIDPRFGALFNSHAQVEKLAGGCRWSEGPAWFGAGRYLVWSDIPNDRMMRYDETDGSVSVFRFPANNSNGNTVDREGRLVTCEHGGRRVSRTRHDGTVETVADRFEGKRLNSPNDAVVKSDGSIWFTDPSYGIDSDFEGNKATSEIGACNVYRIDGVTRAVTAVITSMVRPNGLAFSPDEKLLYVADTGATHKPGHPPEMRVFDVDGDTVGNGRQFCLCTAGLFDGFRLDTDGRIWTSAA
ncbi:MAG TPA: SMP-30/gluconolactonase/LRE family protein, partial [Devosia sp.]|nr:SMP-30/gluconolactonase/LRE family protein [Devosia sp.]